MQRLAIITAVGVLCLVTITQAGITDFTLDQSDSNIQGDSVDLTIQGTMDWGLFAQGPGGQAGFDIVEKPYESKSGGAGFTSLSLIGGADWNTAASFTLTYSERIYSWTDGTVGASGASSDGGSYLNAFGRVDTVATQGAGTRLAIDVAQAGTYQLTYYAATFNLALDATATLQSEGVDFDEFSPITSGIESSGLDDYVFTVDFTTAGADTLYLDVINSSTTAGAYALEAFILTGTEPPSEFDLGNIWPLGDSITYGAAVPASIPGGYRDPLYTNLMAKGYTFSFVGSVTANSSPTLTSAGQQHHDGHSGYTIKDISGYSGTGRGLYDELAAWMPINTPPDLILLMIGINDINHDYDIETAPDRLDELVTRLFTFYPDSRILISTLTEAEGDNAFRGGATNDLSASISDYNAALSAMVVDRRALDQNIELVDMHAGLTVSDLKDKLHPSDEGYEKMGNIWADAIIATPPSFTTNSISAAGGMVSLEATGALGTSYSLWTTDDLTTNDWSLMIYDSISTNPFTVMNAVTNDQQYYRFSTP